MVMFLAPPQSITEQVISFVFFFISKNYFLQKSEEEENIDKALWGELEVDEFEERVDEGEDEAEEEEEETNAEKDNQDNREDDTTNNKAPGEG